MTELNQWVSWEKKNFFNSFVHRTMPCNKEGPTQLGLKAGAYFRNVRAPWSLPYPKKQRPQGGVQSVR
jgi:hypothetical protein